AFFWTVASVQLNLGHSGAEVFPLLVTSLPGTTIADEVQSSIRSDCDNTAAKDANGHRVILPTGSRTDAAAILRSRLSGGVARRSGCVPARVRWWGRQWWEPDLANDSRGRFRARRR